MTSCLISPYEYRTSPRRMALGTLRGGGPVLKREQCGWEACLFKAEFEHRMRCTTAGTWCSIPRTVCPSADSSAASADAARRLSCLAGGTAETELGGS